jgi:hypothetical protein
MWLQKAELQRLGYSMRKGYLFAVLATVAMAANGCSRKAPTPQDELEKQFSQMMTGVTLVGHSTRLNMDGIAGDENYAIDKVSKITGEAWLIHARIQYRTHEVPIPVPVAIKWAGDTPVITLTDLSIPGMGTYTARVLLYRGQYAGTWSGQKGGGQIFGKIVPRR